MEDVNKTETKNSQLLHRLPREEAEHLAIPKVRHPSDPSMASSTTTLANAQAPQGIKHGSVVAGGSAVVRMKMPKLLRTYGRKQPDPVSNPPKILSIVIHQPPPDFDFICRMCGRNFRSKALLRSHMRLQHPIPYECPQCGKKLRTQSALTGHITGHGRPYECPECKKRFGKRSTLTRHMVAHTGERPHTCTHCQKTFTQRSAMLLHVRRFHVPA